MSDKETDDFYLFDYAIADAGNQRAECAPRAVLRWRRVKTYQQQNAPHIN